MAHNHGVTKSDNNPLFALLSFPAQGSIGGTVLLFVLAEAIVRLVAGLVLPAPGGAGVILLLIAASIVGVMMSVLLIQYSSVVFVASAMGQRTVRVVDIDDLLPFSRPITARLLLLAMLLGGGFYLLLHRTGPTAFVAAAGVALLLLPAVLTILALEDSLPSALGPRNLYELVSQMGAWYALMPLVCAAAATVIWFAQHSALPWPARTLASGYGLFLAIHLLGRIVYHRRDRIGLAVSHSPELSAQADEAALRERHAVMLQSAYQVSITSVADALRDIEAYLVGDLDNLATREWMFERLGEWRDKATAVWFANDLVARQLRQGHADRAIATTAWCLTHNPAFRPKGADATFELASAALHGGRNLICTAVLSDFAERFPDSPHAVPALLLCARVALEKTNQRSLARQLIARLNENDQYRDDPRVEDLRNLAGTNQGE